MAAHREKSLQEVEACDKARDEGVFGSHHQHGDYSSSRGGGVLEDVMGL